MLTKALIEEQKLARDFQFFMEVLAPKNSKQKIKKVDGDGSGVARNIESVKKEKIQF